MHTTSSYLIGKYFDKSALVRLIKHLFTIVTSSSSLSWASFRSESVAAASCPRIIGFSNFRRNSLNQIHKFIVKKVAV